MEGIMMREGWNNGSFVTLEREKLLAVILYVCTTDSVV